MKRLLLCCLLLCACSPAVDPDPWERVVGTIETGLGEVLLAPDAVTAGVPFTITVTTRGSSSCTRADGAHVVVQGRIAAVTPYDRVNTRGACTDDLHPFPRDVELTFAVSGSALIRVYDRLGQLAEEAAVEVRAGG
jgi:hypothetical protein